jgi:insulysin
MQRCDQFVLPNFDKRAIRYVKLPNNIKCMLVSDNESK